LGGVVGMLLAVPVASTLRALAAEWLWPEVRRLAGHAPAGGSDPPAG
jgi:predicted PurR-regulated permease PerM